MAAVLMLMARHRSGLPFHEPLPGGVIEMGEAISSRCSARVLDQRGVDLWGAVFPSASSAIQAAKQLIVELALSALSDGLVGVAAGVCTGEFGEQAESLIEKTRMFATAAEAEQILVDGATREICSAVLPDTYGFHSLSADTVELSGSSASAYQVLHPQLRRVFREARSLERRPNNVPHRGASFIGREHEMAELNQLLDEHRAVTVIGVAGIGKTSIACRVALERFEEYEDGIRYIDLRDWPRQEDVWHLLASHLAIRIAPQWSAEEAVRYDLDRKDFLLLLDNATEHGATLRKAIPTLLRSSAGLQVLITARAPLRYASEARFNLGSLSTFAGTDFEPDLGADAIRLFQERAAMVRSDFRVSSENIGDVREICRRLDGNPLAIELVASRSSTWLPQEILASWHDLALEDVLGSALAWSVGFLDGETQKVFRRISILKGDITNRTAQALAPELSSRAVGRILTELVDSHLLAAGDSVFSGDQIFRMGSQSRSLASKELAASGELRQVERIRNEWIAEISRTANDHLTGPDQDVWMQRLERFLPDIESAVDALIRERDVTTAATILSGFASLWVRRPAIAPMATLDAFLRQFGSLDDEATLTVKGSVALAVDAKAGASARRLFIETYVQARRAGRYSLAGRVVSNLARMYNRLGDGRRSERCVREALKWLRRAGDEQGEVALQIGSAFALQQEGRVAEARAIYRLVERSRVFRKDRFLQAFAFSGEAQALEQTGELHEAIRLMLRAIRLAAEHGFTQELAGYSQGLARMELNLGNAGKALRILAAVRGACSRQEAFLGAADMMGAEGTFSRALDRVESSAFLPHWEQLPIYDVVSILYDPKRSNENI